MKKEKKNIILKTECHSRCCRPQDSGIYDTCRCVREQQTSCVEDPRLQASGMTALLKNSPSSVLTGHLPPHGESANFNVPSTWRERVYGFTLIELLVVVLIIGILAAVALPQYQKVVEKARVTEAIQNMNKLQQAVDLFVLENGDPISDNEEINVLTKLSIDIPNSKHFTYTAVYNTIDSLYSLQAITKDTNLQIYSEKYTRDKTWNTGCQYGNEKWKLICEATNDLGHWSYISYF